jgi:23S rRNA pseudouridine1911/1915/1917 synthase
VTDYRVLKPFADFALVELQIHTGRTHQIRVHMAHIGHPVVGDTTYGRKLESRNSKSEISIVRPLLHAYKLSFTHPRSEQFVEFTAPVPEDMVRMCES